MREDIDVLEKGRGDRGQVAACRLLNNEWKRAKPSFQGWAVSLFLKVFDAKIHWW